MEKLRKISDEKEGLAADSETEVRSVLAALGCASGRDQRVAVDPVAGPRSEARYGNFL